MIQSAQKTFIKINITIITIIVILHFLLTEGFLCIQKNQLVSGITIYNTIQYIIKFSVICSVLSCVNILMYFRENLNVKGRRGVKVRDEDETELKLSQMFVRFRFVQSTGKWIWEDPSELDSKEKHTHFNWVWYISRSVVYLAQC